MKKILIVLLTAIILCGVCVFAALCENSGSGNSLFTDEFFDGANEIFLSMGVASYKGEDMQVVIDILKDIRLTPVEENVFEEMLSDDKYGAPFTCIVYYDDGHKAMVDFLNDRVQMSAERNDKKSDKNFTVPSNDFASRLYNVRDKATLSGSAAAQLHPDPTT